MVSPGRLFLLLMSSLLLSAVIVSTSPNRKQVVKEDLKEIGRGIRENIDKIGSAVIPFLELISDYGGLIGAVCNLALLVVSGTKTDPVLAALKSGFESLNFKLDEYHIEQKWDTWASGAYHKPEMDIHLGWTAFNTFLDSVQQAKDDEDEKQRHMKEFIKTYSQYEPATKKLHKLLTAKGTTFIHQLGELLAEHVTCHEKAIRAYTVFIYKLIVKGNTMNQLYYTLKKIKSQARDDEGANIAYESASAMFQIHKHCIVNSTDYIKKDVILQIDQTKHRGELAKRVRSFLADTYDRYDWMVVAFITKHSDISISMVKTLNKHILSGFTEVTKGEVSVAVARQVKGNHTMASKVHDAISKCFAKSVLCTNVENTLKQCRETVEGILVSQTYTAVHAFIDKGHDSYEEKDLKEQDPSAYSPFIYKGKCNKSPGIKGGEFVVMIKSDEEIMTKDPCSKLKCNEPKGECVRVKNTFLAMCDCKLPYYGQHCEKSLDDYKKELQKKTIEVEKDGSMWVAISVSK